MYKVCKTQQSYQRQRLIEDVLIQMMQKEHFSNIKISELCQKADIPRKAFYRYFDTKEDVLYAVIDHTLLDFVSFSGENVRENIFTSVDVMEELYKFWSSHRELIRALETSNCVGLLVERAVFLEIYGEGNVISENYVNNELLERNVFAYTGVFSVMITWLRVNDKTPREMAEITVDLLTKPLF